LLDLLARNKAGGDDDLLFEGASDCERKGCRSNKGSRKAASVPTDKV